MDLLQNKMAGSVFHTLPAGRYGGHANANRTQYPVYET